MCFVLSLMSFISSALALVYINFGDDHRYAPACILWLSFALILFVMVKMQIKKKVWVLIEHTSSSPSIYLADFAVHTHPARTQMLRC